jgi:hypothetical protein
MITSNSLAIGKAAEHLVCADLLLRGFNAMLADAGQPFDILVIIGKVIYTIQVKARTSPTVQKNHTLPRYAFKLYEKQPWESVDFYALVALDINKIAYVTKEEAKRDMRFSPDPLDTNSFSRMNNDFSTMMLLYGAMG